jgi:hypothetical protein
MKKVKLAILATASLVITSCGHSTTEESKTNVSDSTAAVLVVDTLKTVETTSVVGTSSVSEVAASVATTVEKK